MHSEIVHLWPGEALLFYTDGVTESRPVGGGEQLDESGVIEVLKLTPAGADADDLAEAVAEAGFSRSDHVAGDDAGVVVIRVEPVDQ